MTNRSTDRIKPTDAAPARSLDVLLAIALWVVIAGFMLVRGFKTRHVHAHA